jgi:hypothetical protein
VLHGGAGLQETVTPRFPTRQSGLAFTCGPILIYTNYLFAIILRL